MAKYGKGNADKANPSGQDMANGGKGGKMKNVGFGENDSKATGSAGMGNQKKKSDYCTTPDGQEMNG